MTTITTYTVDTDGVSQLFDSQAAAITQALADVVSCDWVTDDVQAVINCSASGDTPAADEANINFQPDYGTYTFGPGNNIVINYGDGYVVDGSSRSTGVDIELEHLVVNNAVVIPGTSTGITAGVSEERDGPQIWNNLRIDGGGTLGGYKGVYYYKFPIILNNPVIINMAGGAIRGYLDFVIVNNGTLAHCGVPGNTNHFVQSVVAHNSVVQDYGGDGNFFWDLRSASSYCVISNSSASGTNHWLNEVVTFEADGITPTTSYDCPRLADCLLDMEGRSREAITAAGPVALEALVAAVGALLKAFNGEDFVSGILKRYESGEWVERPLKVLLDGEWVTVG